MGSFASHFSFCFLVSRLCSFGSNDTNRSLFFEKDDCVRPWNENDHDVYKQQTTASFFGSFSGKGQEAANNDNSYSSPPFSFL